MREIANACNTDEDGTRFCLEIASVARELHHVHLTSKRPNKAIPSTQPFEFEQQGWLRRGVVEASHPGCVYSPEEGVHSVPTMKK